MSDQSPRPRGNPAWRPGGPSPNPRGRPRSGLAFAERVRERVDPDLLIDLALRVAEDEELAPAERLAALLPLIDRGFIRPPTTIAARVETTGGGLPAAFANLSDDELRLEIARRRALLAGDPRSSDAPVSDEDPIAAHLLPTGSEST